MNTKNKPKICLIAHKAYGAMANANSAHIGGVEWQTTLMAKWLAAREYDISMLTWDTDHPENQIIDKVKLIKICHENAGFPGLRFFHPKWTSLIQAMKAADADIYYQNCGECVTGQAALWCKKNKKKFVYSVANDVDVQKNLPEMKKLRDRILYRYGIKNADKIIVQTEFQKKLLKQSFNRESTVIPMPCTGPSQQEYQPPELKTPLRILWIARICRQKRPDKLINIAKKCHDINFDLVGPVYKTKYAQNVLKQTKKISNINIHGPIPRDQTHQFYQQASALISTSEFEGFPNTFLEAWSYGLPIFSTFDPDNLIKSRKLGFTSASIDELAQALNNLRNSPDVFNMYSKNAREYYTQNHTPEIVMPKFEKIFLNLKP